MTRPFTAGLAVARLAELRPARSHRREIGRPMQGYCLITCDADFSRVTLYVENGQTLTDRSGTGGFYYEGWLVGPSGAVSLGAFNVGPDGHGSATRTVASSQAQPGRAELVRVTVEPFGGTEAGNISVLEGRLIWLDTAMPAQAAPAGSFVAPAAPSPATAFPAWPEGGPGDWASRAAAAGLSAIPPQAGVSQASQASAGTVVVAEPTGGPSCDGTAGVSGDGSTGDQFGADFPAGLARQFGGDSPAGLALQTAVDSAAGAAPQAGAGASSGLSYQSGAASAACVAGESGASPAGVAAQSGAESSGAGPTSQLDVASAAGAASPSGAELSATGEADQPGGASPSGAAFQTGAASSSAAAFQSGADSSGGSAQDSGAESSGDPAHDSEASAAAPAAGPGRGSTAVPAPERPERGAAAQADRAGTSVPADSDAAPAQAPPAPSRVNPLTVQVQLVQRHPMTPRASGSATLNLRRGSMTINLRGLPSPMALGRDRTTGRPFNAYRVWLVNQRNQIRTPVGYCERAWGENFRFQADGLPLNRNDTILVTVEDRSAASSVGHASPQVLIGSYEP